jgi:hypothetical protein
MTQYKVIIEDRGYTNWSFHNANTFEKLELNLNPLTHKLFSNDIFILSKNLEPTIIHSSIRVGGDIPGVLVLKNILLMIPKTSNTTQSCMSSFEKFFKLGVDDNLFQACSISMKLPSLCKAGITLWE